MIELLFTLDYEIYGSGAGRLGELVWEPTQRLISIFQERNLKFVVFPEILELRKIEEAKADEAIFAVRNQLRQMFEGDFEIGLHIHSWWFNAARRKEGWLLDWKESNLCALSEKRVEEIIAGSIAYLRELLGSPSFVPLSFRNGLWVMQPTPTLARALADHGIKIDSTVFKGGRIRSLGLDYRPSLRNGATWRFDRDINTPDPNGKLLEVPIHSEMVPFWKMAGRKRGGLQKKAPPSGESGNSPRRLADFARFRYPRKLDFCRMRLSEMKKALDDLIRRDRKSPQDYKPIVAVGHSKDLSDFDSVRYFCDYVKIKEIPVTNFRGVLDRLPASPLGLAETKSIKKEIQ